MRFYKSAVANVVITPVLVPDVEDRNGDVISSNEIQKTAYEFIKNLDKKTVNIDHEDGTDVEGAEYVESYVAPVDMAMGEGTLITKGTWIVGIKLPENIYKQAIQGEYGSVSMEGYGNVKEL